MKINLRNLIRISKNNNVITTKWEQKNIKDIIMFIKEYALNNKYMITDITFGYYGYTTVSFGDDKNFNFVKFIEFLNNDFLIEKIKNTFKNIKIHDFR